MAYTTSSPILGSGTASAEAIQAWFRTKGPQYAPQFAPDGTYKAPPPTLGQDIIAVCQRWGINLRYTLTSCAFVAPMTQAMRFVMLIRLAAIDAVVMRPSPALAAVDTHVFGTGDDLQVLDPVIQHVVVSVVDDLIGCQVTPNIPFHHQPMLSNVAMLRRWVTRLVDITIAVIDRPATAVTISGTVPSRFLPIRLYLKRIAASLACEGDTLGVHRSLQSAGAMPRVGATTPGLHRASILPSTSQKAVL